jgi:hypothetical protein
MRQAKKFTKKALLAANRALNLQDNSFICIKKARRIPGL